MTDAGVHSRALHIVRGPQLRALGLAAHDVFVENLARHVALVFPGYGRAMQGRAGHRFIAQCVAAAAKHGLHDRHSVALYTDLVAALGPGFESQPCRRWIVDVLENTALDSAARMFLIYNQLPERCPEAPVLLPIADEEHVVEDGPQSLVRLWPARDWG